MQIKLSRLRQKQQEKVLHKSWKKCDKKIEKSAIFAILGKATKFDSTDN
jgi:hypothetical protein